MSQNPGRGGEAARLPRRTFLERLLAAGFMPRVIGPGVALTVTDAASVPTGSAAALARFAPVSGSDADTVVVPAGYNAQVVLRWGDGLFDYAPQWHPGEDLTRPGAAIRQARQFGDNCDYNAYFPLPGFTGGSSQHGLLCTNHEFVNPRVMFPGLEHDNRTDFLQSHPEAVAVMQAAHGVSVVELVRDPAGAWRRRPGSRYTRRITEATPMRLSGPAAGHRLLASSIDATGYRVAGTLNNCAGGVTPWGTLLTCEENIDKYFGNLAGLRRRAASRDATALRGVLAFHRRLAPADGLSDFGWEVVAPRYDVARHPTEPFGFGWVVELDPYDRRAEPVKRTALGRFKHEGAATTLATDGRAVVYSGDDARFEYVYKFVSSRVMNSEDRDANRDLLDDGTLYVARFNEDGTGCWLPLVWSDRPLDPDNPLNPSNGFNSQAEVLIDARRAGDVVGATPMDRPEDIEWNPVTERLYLALTNNDRRAGVDCDSGEVPLRDGVDAANPRPDNRTGHLLEIAEVGNDPGGVEFHWELLLLCGDPSAGVLAHPPPPPIPSRLTYFAGYTRMNQLSPIGCPDNLAIDPAGNLWVCTDGQTRALNGGLSLNDGVYVVDLQGEHRGRVRQFLSGPRGCEIAGPAFTPDGSTLFLSVQHPGQDRATRAATSDWPDRGGRPPRASVIAVSRI